MFTIRKIFNAGTNIPETTSMPTAKDTAYMKDCLLVLKDGVLTNPASTEKPTYVAAESAGKNEKATLVCYPIFANMLFEAPMLGTPSTIKAGDKVTIVENDDYFVDKVGSDKNNGVATVVDMNGATANGDKVYVRFD